MQTDPFEARRSGAHRLRVVTASIGAAAVVGTGALAWSVASTESASAGTTNQNGEESDDGGATTSTTDDDGQFVAPYQLPQTSSSGSSHASSGGS
jgi:hypothetical protein